MLRSIGPVVSSDLRAMQWMPTASAPATNVAKHLLIPLYKLPPIYIVQNLLTRIKRTNFLQNPVAYRPMLTDCELKSDHHGHDCPHSSITDAIVQRLSVVVK